MNRRKINALKKQVQDIREGNVKTIPLKKVMASLKVKTKIKDN